VRKLIKFLRILKPVIGFAVLVTQRPKVGKVIPNLVKLSDRTEEVEGPVTKLETDVKINHDKNNDNLLKMNADLIKSVGFANTKYIAISFGDYVNC